MFKKMLLSGFMLIALSFGASQLLMALQPGDDCPSCCPQTYQGGTLQMCGGHYSFQINCYYGGGPNGWTMYRLPCY